MELYLFIALFLIYILTSLMADKAVIRKVWLAAFLVSFVVTAVAVSFLRFSNQEVMMNATELSWYYILYLFASLMVVRDQSLDVPQTSVENPVCQNFRQRR